MLLLVFAPFSAGAEEMVLHRFSAEEPDIQLERTLYLTAGTELVKAGMSSTRSAQDADYILLTEYSFADSVVELAYTLYEAKAAEREAVTREFELRIDHNIGSRVAEEVRLLLEKAGIEPKPSAEAEIEGLLPDFSTSDTEATTVPPAGRDTGSEITVEEDAEEEPEQKTEQETLEKEKPSGAPSRSTPSPGETEGTAQDKPDTTPVVFAVSTAVTGLMLFGDVTEYLHYGAAGKIGIGATWLGERRSIALEADISFNRVFNDYGTVGGPLYISTAGASLQIGTGSRLPYRIAGGISGGAAVLTVAGENETLSKTVPYAKVGVHSLFPLGGGYSIGADVGFMMIFDEDVLIPAATPAVMLRKEL